jgi:hypothetical protein
MSELHQIGASSSPDRTVRGFDTQALAAAGSGVTEEALGNLNERLLPFKDKSKCGYGCQLESASLALGCVESRATSGRATGEILRLTQAA